MQVKGIIFVTLFLIFFQTIVETKKILFISQFAGSQFSVNLKIAEQIAQAGHDVSLLLLSDMPEIESLHKVTPIIVPGV